MLFTSDPLVQGGIILALIAAASTLVYRGVPLLWSEIRKRLITTMDIQGTDELFKIFTRWLGSIDYGKKSRLMTVSSGRGFPTKEGSTCEEQGPVFSPGPGNHYFRYKGVFCIIGRGRKEMDKSTTFELYEDYTITMFTRRKDLAKEMIEEAITYSRSLEVNMTMIYSHNTYGEWIRISEQRDRPIGTVFMKDKSKQMLIDDVDNFIRSEDWYVNHGIPYRRGYLFYGPPGTGKTSIIKAIAGKYKMNVYILNMSSKMTEVQFVAMLSRVPRRSAVLFEDIDGMFDGRERTGADSVSFKAFINGIDGIGSPEGTLLFMTTNHVEKLDPALIRPGRVDFRLEMTWCDEDQAEGMYRSFYGSEGLEDFMRMFCKKVRSTADVQKILMSLRPGVLQKDPELSPESSSVQLLQPVQD